MAEQSKVGGKKGRKIGRNKKKCELYRAHKTREKNKLRRVLKSNGYAAAKAYAARYGLAVPQQKG